MKASSKAATPPPRFRISQNRVVKGHPGRLKTVFKKALDLLPHLPSNARVAVMLEIDGELDTFVSEERTDWPPNRSEVYASVGINTVRLPRDILTAAQLEEPKYARKTDLSTDNSSEGFSIRSEASSPFWSQEEQQTAGLGISDESLFEIPLYVSPERLISQLPSMSATANDSAVLLCQPEAELTGTLMAHDFAASSDGSPPQAIVSAQATGAALATPSRRRKLFQGSRSLSHERG